MLSILFFLTIFSSLLWVAYACLYIHGLLSGADLSSLDIQTMALYAGLVIVPLWAVWQIFGFISRYCRDKNFNLRLAQLFNQMKKNQDYTDLVVRVMLDAEHEIKDGFVINKFDIFIADMNELLADIVQRCNAASSLQLEQLWARVKNGERWTIGKTLIEAAKNYNDFSSYLAEKARKDSVFKGTLLEFCDRYQNLNALLEKHDRDRVFITIIETGVMGKVYSILAPATEALENAVSEQRQLLEAEEKTFEISPNILTMEAPQNDEEPVSFFTRLNPFKRKRKDADSADSEQSSDDYEFFTALHKSMSLPEKAHRNFSHDYDRAKEMVKAEPRFLHQSEDVVLEEEKSIADGKSEQATVEETDYIIPEVYLDAQSVAEIKAVETESQTIAAERTAMPKEQKPVDKPQDIDFAYPFGGWTNEENYKK